MIRAENLSKYYGLKRALGPVSFEIADGEAVGFLGLNGAGKTTALRIFACDLRPSAGTVVVGDIDAVASPHEVRKRIGFLPEAPPLYADMRVDDYLRYTGRLRAMSKSAVEKRLPEVLDLTDLADVSTELIRNLSHGYRQRVGLGQAIVHAPSLLILDEPTRGLDPVQIVEMRKLLANLKEKHTVLISSHILTEISETCDRLLVLGDGEIIAEGSEDDLAAKLKNVERNSLSATVSIRPKDADPFRDAPDAALSSALSEVEGVGEVSVAGREDDGSITFELRMSEDVRADVARKVVEGGHDLTQLLVGESELENIFLRLVQGGTTDANN